MKRSIKFLLYTIGIIVTPILLFFNYQAFTTHVGYWAYDENRPELNSSKYCLPASPFYYDDRDFPSMTFAWAKSKACEEIGLVGEAMPPIDYYYFQSPSGVNITLSHNTEELFFLDPPQRARWTIMWVYYLKPDGTHEEVEIFPEKTFPGKSFIGGLMGILALMSYLLIFCSPFIVCIGAVCLCRCVCFSKSPPTAIGNEQHAYEIANGENDESEV